MNTTPTLYDLRSLIAADNAAKVASGEDSCKELLGELNGELLESGDCPVPCLDPLYALPLLKDALKRLHQINEKKRLAWAALEIARNLLQDFANDTNSSQEDGGELCDNENDWSVIQVNAGLDIDAQNAEYTIERLKEMVGG